MAGSAHFNVSYFNSDNATCVNLTNVSTSTIQNAQKPFYFNDNLLYCYFGPLQFLKPLEVFLCYVNPSLSCLWLVVNALSMAILRKSGLGQPSTILLFALVLADSMNLVQHLNIADKLRMFGQDKSQFGYCTWEYDGHTNEFLFISYQIMLFIGQWGHFVNNNIPVIITVERLLAVYFPVTFKKVVTVRSAVTACVLVYLLWFPWSVFQAFFRQLGTVKLPNGKLVSFSLSSAVLRNNFTLIYTFVAYALEALVSWLPLGLVCAGCLLIAIKVKISIYRRRQLFKVKEKQKWSPKTTRTLLTTCLIFAICHACTSLISVLSPVDFQMPLLTFFVVEVSEFINILNCSSNFFVYITSNRKLWKIFLDIVHKK